MMNPLWLIDADSLEMRSEQLQAELARQGHVCRVVRFFPEKRFPHDIAGAEKLAFDADVIFFGASALMHHIQTQRRWRPGGWCTFANFSCDVYYTYFGKHLLNSAYTFLSAAECVRQSEHLFATYGIQRQVFARPAIGRKLFTGGLFDAEKLAFTLSKTPDPRTLIVVSSPRAIQREWRLYVVDNQIVTSSQYANQGRLELLPQCPENVFEYGKRILHETDWRPDMLFTMDICESNNSLHLLELNGFSCSNLYECDLEALVRATARVAS